MRDLLRVIDETPDDDAAWQPLADYLMDRADPRGELIAIDLALERGDVPERAELLGRRAEILAAHAPALLGATFARAVADGYGTIAWRRGFVDAVSYAGDRNLRHRKAVGWLVALMTTTREPFWFLRRLAVPYTDLADVRPLLAFAHLEEVDVTGTNVVDVTPLRALPRLRHVAHSQPGV